MKTALLLQKLSVIAGSITLFSLLANPVQAQTCTFFDSEAPNNSVTVEVGQRFELTPRTEYIRGATAGSRIYLHRGPGTNYPTDGSYGLVGEDVTVIGYAFDQNCEHWMRVQFPVSGYTGWLHLMNVGSYRY